ATGTTTPNPAQPTSAKASTGTTSATTIQKPAQTIPAKPATAGGATPAAATPTITNTAPTVPATSGSTTPATTLHVPAEPATSGSFTPSATAEPTNTTSSVSTDSDSTERPAQTTQTPPPASVAPISEPIPFVLHAPAGDTSTIETIDKTVESTPQVNKQINEQQSKPLSTAHDYSQPVLKLDHRLSESRLPNGLRLIVHTVKSSPVVQIAGCISAGSPYDPPDKSGIAELNVELMNGDSTKISRENSVKHQQRNGLSARDLINVELDREYLKFQAACSVSDLELELKLLTHHLLNPLLTEEALKTAKAKVAAKVKKRFESPDDNTQRLLLSSLLDKNSSFAPSSPRVQMQSTDQITMDDVSSFRAATMSPAATTIVLSGNITLQSAIAAVNGAFKDWRATARAPRAVILPERRRVTKVTVPTESGTSVKMAVGKLLPLTADNTRILLADCVLSTHPLYARLLDLKHSPANKSLHIASDILPLSSTCAWVLNLDVPDNGVRDASNMLKQKLQTFSRDGINASEFEEAKKFVSGQIAVSKLNNVENSARAIVDSVIANGTPSTIFQIGRA
ncbi:MAG: insulinase family protein, partial [Cyanobacteria bacterium]|nr:insulinase family protein [Cyanobacteriota bacterium]